MVNDLTDEQLVELAIADNADAFGVIVWFTRPVSRRGTTSLFKSQH